jgi:hypothetical protein
MMKPDSTFVLDPLDEVSVPESIICQFPESTALALAEFDGLLPPQADIIRTHASQSTALILIIRGLLALS